MLSYLPIRKIQVGMWDKSLVPSCNLQVAKLIELSDYKLSEAALPVSGSRRGLRDLALAVPGGVGLRAERLQ